jgi:hypothetical protein
MTSRDSSKEYKNKAMANNSTSEHHHQAPALFKHIYQLFSSRWQLKKLAQLANLTCPSLEQNMPPGPKLIMSPREDKGSNQHQSNNPIDTKLFISRSTLAIHSEPACQITR